jgi:hypothetical protein
MTSENELHLPFISSNFKRMKKNLTKLSFLMMTCSFSLNAQITINSSDVVEPQYEIVQNTDTLPSIDFPASGSDMNWDMTGLNLHTQDVLGFGMPQWFSSASYFPGTNLAVNQGGGEAYFFKDAQKFELRGFSADIFGTGMRQIYYIPGNEILRFPTQYQDAYNTEHLQTITLPGEDLAGILPIPFDSVIVRSTQLKTVTVDGWGSLTTPSGTYDVLRINETLVTFDTITGYFFGQGSELQTSSDTTYTLNFWSNDPTTKWQVATVNHDGAGTVTSVNWLNGEPQLSVEELSNDLTVYPNPVTDKLNVSDEDLQEWTVYTSEGKKIRTTTSSSMDVSALNSGIYFYNILLKDGTVKTGNFIKD